MSERNSLLKAFNERPLIAVDYRTEKGNTGQVVVDLSDLPTLDGADVEFQLKKAEQELRRLDSSRQFNGQHRGR